MPITTATPRKSAKPTSMRKNSPKSNNTRKSNNVRTPLMTNRKSTPLNAVLRWRDIRVRPTSLSIREEFMKLRRGKSMAYDSFSIPMMSYIFKIFKGNIPRETQGMTGYDTVPKNLNNTNMKKMPSLLNNIDPNNVKFTVERDSTKAHWYDISIVYFPAASTITVYDDGMCCGGKKTGTKFPVKAGEVVLMDSKRYQTSAAKSVAILVKFF